MFNRDTDREWERFGKDDAYFGVFSLNEYRKNNMSEVGKEKFFKSGSDYIDKVTEIIKRHIDPDFKVCRAVDFGCGVGRLTIPLARFASEVTAVDVSDSMLLEAERNCKAESINNVSFVKGDDNFSLLKGTFDFINSFIVFQHIPVPRGQLLFEKLLTRLEAGGVCVAHFTYASEKRAKRFIDFVKRWIPLSANFINLFKGEKFFAPQMQMNEYDLNRLFLTMQKANVFNCYTEFTNHNGELGLMICFKKSQVLQQPRKIQ